MIWGYHYFWKHPYSSHWVKFEFPQELHHNCDGSILHPNFFWGGPGQKQGSSNATPVSEWWSDHPHLLPPWSSAIWKGCLTTTTLRFQKTYEHPSEKTTYIMLGMILQVSGPRNLASQPYHPRNRTLTDSPKWTRSLGVPNGWGVRVPFCNP